MNPLEEHGSGSDAIPLVIGSPNEEQAHRILEHLELLLSDAFFVNSKRLQAFLRYVVTEALAGNHDPNIKERTIGIVAFGRPPDYDTNADPVVRMAAGEVRKKLAQFYFRNASDVQIEVPLGSYLPRFRCSPMGTSAPSGRSLIASPMASTAPSAASTPPSQAVTLSMVRSASWRTVFWACATLALLTLATICFAVWGHRAVATSVDSFWNGFSGPSKQVLIVLPALSRTPQPQLQYHFEAESVALEDAEVATRLSNEFKLRGLDSHLVLATGVSLSDLRGSPFVLIGALDNVWTMRLSQSLPFAFERSDDRRFGSITDRKDLGRHWTQDFSVPNSQIPQDYGIIARFTDSTTEQPTVLVAGISAEGTLAAGEAVTTPRYLDTLLKAAGNSHNFEAVIQTRVIDGRSGPPEVLAVRTW